MILAGRRLNDKMGMHVAGQITQLMAARRIHVKGARALVLWHHFQGELPRREELEGSWTWCANCRKTGGAGGHLRSVGQRFRCRHAYGLEPVRALRSARYEWRSWPWRTGSSGTRRTRCAQAVQTKHVL